MRPLVRRAATAAALLLAAVAPAAAQQVVDFDDIDPANLRATSTLIRNGGVFDGLRFDAASRWATGTFAGSNVGQLLICHSQPYCSSPNGMNPDGSSFGAFSFLSPSRFFGLWLSGPAWTDAVPIGGVGTTRTHVAAELWRGGSLVYTTPFLDVTPEPQFLSVAYGGAVDGVRLVGDPAWTVVDDITFSATPEPATLALVGGGMLGIVGVRQRLRGRRAVGRRPGA